MAMTIDTITKGKTYYYTTTANDKDKSTGRKRRNFTKVFVVEVDVPGHRVCASMNGTPAQWFGPTKYSRWKKENPEPELNPLLPNLKTRK
jgi:hypothetical protein